MADVTQTNVLLFGGGGREHALAVGMSTSPRLGKLWTTHPGNPGIAALASPIDAPVDITQAYRMQQFCAHNNIGLVVIGPEEPLAQGWADALSSDRTVVFGPCAEAARLEADKGWAKQLMRSALVPTAEGQVLDSIESARAYLVTRQVPPVIKAVGLAKGKGVVVPDSMEEAEAAIEQMMVKRVFGAAGDRVLIEERLEGPEVSILALVDGRNLLILDACQDHKRLREGDTGPNTGGMGAYCPSPLVDAPLMVEIQEKILIPTIDAVRREGIDYRGVLYAGIILTHGGPKVLEFNVRFGDPECQCILPRLKGDLLELLSATAAGRLDRVDIDWDPRPACCIVLAAEGYPASPRSGDVITGIDDAQQLEGVTIYHAGTHRDQSGNIVTAGGRVLNVVGIADTLESARNRALEACDLIHFEGKQLRCDIASQAIGTATHVAQPPSAV